MATRLEQLTRQRQNLREEERLAMLGRLRLELERLLPRGTPVWVFGSAAAPGRFTENSDVDLALGRAPDAFSEFWLQGELESTLGRRVDVVLLAETRLRPMIEREALRWTI